MEGPRRGELKIIPCRSAVSFSQKIVDEINQIHEYEGIKSLIGVEKADFKKFADTDFVIKIKENIRGKDVYVIQTGTADTQLGASIHDNFMELIYTIEAAKREGKAANVVAVIPNFFYARQDKTRGRESFNAKIAAEMLEAVGINGLICLELHASQIKGFFRNVWVENLFSSNILIDFLKTKYDSELKNWAYASADVGGFPRVEHYAKVIGGDTAISVKRRSYEVANMVEKIYVLGEVKNKTICIIDDIVDTAGTLKKAALKFIEEGAKEVVVVCTHALLSDPAPAILRELYEQKILRAVITTDTIVHQNLLFDKSWFIQVSVAPLIAKAIYRINLDRSVSSLYKVKPF